MNNIIKATFAEIGNIRKGAPKGERSPGKDLVDRFRVEFGAGYQAAEDDFMRIYGTMQPKKINALIAFPDISMSWEDYYEAYLGGRLMARATPEGKYLFYRQSETNEIVINEAAGIGSESRMKFDPSDALNWYVGRNGEAMMLYGKRTGRLKVVIPELKRIAFLILHTTSVYDVANINNQLAGYQALAQNLGGNIAGIPLVISRKKKAIHFRNQWGKHSVKYTGMIDIAIHHDFEMKMFNLINRMALPGINAPLQLTDQESETALIEDGIVEGSFEPISREMDTPERPYQPGVLKTKLSIAAEGLTGQEAGHDQRQKIGQIIGQKAGHIQGKVLEYLTNRSSIMEVPAAMIKAMDQWLQEDVALQELQLVAERYS